MTRRRPSGAPAVRRLAAFGSRLVYRDIEVVERGRPPTGPVLAVSSHFGGVADAMLLIALSERFPRIVARDLIWRYPVAGSLMRWIGAIPVRRRADSGDGTARNEDMFAACHEALRAGDVVLIFPEGVTQEDPHLGPIRTGAARIALGARAAGVRGIEVLPIGVHYEDRAAFRSRVLVSFGEPIPLDDVVAQIAPGEDADAGSNDAVHRLTALIAERMGRVGTSYRDWEQARALQLAAEVVLREATPDGAADPAVPLALTQRLAASLADRADDVRAPVEAAASTYRRTLQELDVDDGEAATTPRRAVWHVVRDAVLTVVLLPYAAVGVLLGAVPYLLTQATRLLRMSPPMLSTIMPAVALLAFLGQWTWLTVRTAVETSVTLGAVVAVLAPLCVGSTVFVAERLALLGRASRRWWLGRRSTGPVVRARQERRAVLAAAVEALAAEVGR